MTVRLIQPWAGKNAGTLVTAPGTGDTGVETRLVNAGLALADTSLPAVTAAADASPNTTALAATSNPIAALQAADAGLEPVPGQATAAQLAAKASTINTVGKTKYRVVVDTTNDKRYFALGTTDVAKWRPFNDQSGTADITPA